MFFAYAVALCIAPYAYGIEKQGKGSQTTIPLVVGRTGLFTETAVATFVYDKDEHLANFR